MERHLIKIVGRKNVIGRPFLYGTTKEFLIRFGLKDLNDLPRVEDMAAALGFDAPSILRERSVTEEMLPLEEPHEPHEPPEPHEGHEGHEGTFSLEGENEPDGQKEPEPGPSGQNS